MISDWLDDARRRLLDLRQGPGAWGYRARSTPAVEPSCLAALGLLANEDSPGQEGRGVAIATARWLASIRQPDGSLGVTLDLPEPGWATPFALLLWVESWRIRGRAIGGRRTGSSGSKGQTIARSKDDPMGHDATIVGWPWVAGTHSWVEPTAMALLALGREGLADHARAREGVRLLLDRAIPTGGWNLGNPVVFGNATSAAARANRPGVAGFGRHGSHSKVVDQALDYLRSALAGTLAPISLGWGLLGLRAWQAWPVEGAGWLASAFEMRRESLGRSNWPRSCWRPGPGRWICWGSSLALVLVWSMDDPAEFPDRSSAIDHRP